MILLFPLGNGFLIKGISMQITNTPLMGAKLIQPNVFFDSRGYFFEGYNEKRLNGLGFNEKFVQDNISKSTKNTLRGLHYQIGEHAQGKLCSCLYGKVLDVAVDIRFGSPTFGQYFAVELNDENNMMFWIPPGFAHGFSVISDIAIFSYKCTRFYNKDSERCIIYNDHDLKIDWDNNNPVLSEKDMQGISFKNIEKDFII